MTRRARSSHMTAPWQHPRWRRGFTLVEMVVYMFVAGLVLSAMYSLFWLSQSSYGKATEIFRLEQDLNQVVIWLRRDLRDTTLGSIRSYPHQTPSLGSDDTAPGISLAGARDPNDAMRMLLSPMGTPAWRNHVYYSLLPPEAPGPNGQAGRSRLVRWEDSGPAPSGGAAPTAGAFKVPMLPVATTTLPSAGASGSSTLAGGGYRVLSQALQAPGQAIYGADASGRNTPIAPATPYGGFELAFVRGDGTTTHTPPGRRSDSEDSASWSQGTTGLVEVTLKLVEYGADGKANLLPVTFRVAPRN